jgi:hypothetical protein
MLSTLIDRHAQVHWDDDGPGGHQAQRLWYTKANGTNMNNVPPMDRLHVHTLIDWVQAAGSPIMM